MPSTARGHRSMSWTDGVVTTMASEQGSRQGCAAGSECFCVAIDPLIKTLTAAYPDFKLRIFVDDIFPLVPPPPTGTNEDWQQLYRDMRSSCWISRQIGLSLNIGKCGLLLPGPPPPPLLLTRPAASFQFHLRGHCRRGRPGGHRSAYRLFH